MYEKLDPALAALEALGATPWPEEDLMGDLSGRAARLTTSAAGLTRDAEPRHNAATGRTRTGVSLV